MNDRGRIARLLTFCGLDWPEGGTTHDILDIVDTVMNVDTSGLALPCQAPTHFGISCPNRRYVGARLALLEECMARQMVEPLEEAFQYG